MKTNILRSLAFSLIVWSCTNDEDPGKPTDHESNEVTNRSIELVDPFFKQCDSVLIATSIGTACCTSGPMTAKAGDTVRYHYQMNHRDAQVAWRILEGDLSIIEGEDTQTVTILIGPGFSGGAIQGVGLGIKNDEPDDSPRLLCESGVIISILL